MVEQNWSFREKEKRLQSFNSDKIKIKTVIKILSRMKNSYKKLSWTLMTWKNILIKN